MCVPIQFVFLLRPSRDSVFLLILCFCFFCFVFFVVFFFFLFLFLFLFFFFLSEKRPNWEKRKKPSTTSNAASIEGKTRE